MKSRRSRRCKVLISEKVYRSGADAQCANQLREPAAVAKVGAPLMNFRLTKRLGAATILVTLASLLTSCKTSEPQGHSAWRPIFDGRNTEGWKMTGPGELKLENGQLVTYGG